MEEDVRSKPENRDTEESSVEDGNNNAGHPETVSSKSYAAPGEDVRFNDNIVIRFGERLPELDKGPVKAYAAQGSGKVAGSLVAMICADHLSPRSVTAGKYAGVINPYLARLVASGPVDWPQEKRQKYCFIYENNLGKPIMKDDRTGGLDWSQERVMSAVIAPMINVLTDLHNKDIVHGDIHPGNMFDGGSRTTVDKILLGECLSTPASSLMPAVYETVERALATPTARGTGTREDDLYSFGVSLAVILRSVDPMKGLSDQEIIARKMDLGSYGALTGKDRFTGSILELLRGLLYDDRNQRWTLEEVQAWTDGRRLSPKQSAKKIKAARPAILNGKKYLRPESLARDMYNNIQETVHLIESGELDQWLQRAVEDKDMRERVDQAIQSAAEAGKGAGYAERLTTRTMIALNPLAPVRYKNLCFMPDGLGKAMTEAFVLKKDMTPFVEILTYYFVMQWLDVQEVSSAVDTGALIGRFDSCRAFVRQPKIGYGLERCIYFMDPECRCLSPKLRDFYIRNPEDMMLAFEKIAESPDRPAMFFDRHSVAFLSIKDRKNIDPYLSELGAEEAYKKVLGELKVLATIQKRSRLGNFPGITRWIAGNLGPVYERFHDRMLREAVQKKVEKLKETGDLVKITTIFDNHQTYEMDNLEFRRAMRRYYDLEGEGKRLQNKLSGDKIKKYGQETGQQVAAVFSGVLAAMIILGAVFLALSGRGGSGGLF